MERENTCEFKCFDLGVQSGNRNISFIENENLDLEWINAVEFGDPIKNLPCVPMMLWSVNWKR